LEESSRPTPKRSEDSPVSRKGSNTVQGVKEMPSPWKEGQLVKYRIESGGKREGKTNRKKSRGLVEQHDKRGKIAPGRTPQRHQAAKGGGNFPKKGVEEDVAGEKASLGVVRKKGYGS